MTSTLAIPGSGRPATVGAGRTATVPAVGPIPHQGSQGGHANQSPKTDSASISVAALQSQLAEVRSRIQQISSNCSLCDPTRVTVLAPLYSKAENLQALISAADSLNSRR